MAEHKPPTALNMQHQLEGEPADALKEAARHYQALVDDGTPIAAEAFWSCAQPGLSEKTGYDAGNLALMREAVMAADEDLEHPQERLHG